MIVWEIRSSYLTSILGLTGISIDVVCNSQEVKKLIYDLYKIQR